MEVRVTDDKKGQNGFKPRHKSGGSFGNKNGSFRGNKDGKPWDRDKKPYERKPWDKDNKPWNKDNKDKKPYDKKPRETAPEPEQPQKPIKKVMLRQDLIDAAKNTEEKSAQNPQPMREAQGIAKNILFEDNHVLVVVKPQNLPTQGDKTGDKCLLDELKEYLIEKYDKPGDAYLGLVHRLDRPTGGVMVFAKTSKAAARLSEQIREGDFDKNYAAVTAGKPNRFGRVEHYLFKDERNNYVSLVPSTLDGAKLAVSEVTLVDETYDEPTDERKLAFDDTGHNTDGQETVPFASDEAENAETHAMPESEKLEKSEKPETEKKSEQKLSLVSVKLLTGRTHQVRVQLKALGAPIVGDGKYAGEKLVRSPHLALWAYRLCFTHPVSGDLMLFYSQPPQEFPWTEFDTESLVDTLRPRK